MAREPEDDRSLPERMGLRGRWCRLLAVWDANRGDYEYLEYTSDDTFRPYDGAANVTTVRYRGGPRDGEVEA